MNNTGVRRSARYGNRREEINGDDTNAAADVEEFMVIIR